MCSLNVFWRLFCRLCHNGSNVNVCTCAHVLLTYTICVRDEPGLVLSHVCTCVPRCARYTWHTCVCVCACVRVLMLR